MMSETPPKKNTGLTRILKACGYTRDGLIATFQTEAAFRQEICLAVLLLPLAFFIAPSYMAFGLMAGSVLLVLVVELLNSAIECVVDRISPDHHPLCKQAKDAGSAAVFIALVIVVVIWACCLL